MSDNELRDRIEQIIEDKTYAMAPDGFIAGTEDAAQAIIDNLGLTVEWAYRFEGRGDRIPLARARDIALIGLVGPFEDAVIERRVAGKWEKQ